MFAAALGQKLMLASSPKVCASRTVAQALEGLAWVCSHGWPGECGDRVLVHRLDILSAVGIQSFLVRWHHLPLPQNRLEDPHAFFFEKTQSLLLGGLIEEKIM